MLQRCHHMFCSFLQRFNRGRIFGLSQSRLGLLKHISLRLADDIEVFFVVINSTRLFGLLLNIPRSDDDLLLQAGELLALPALLLSTVLLVLAALALG
ncbi:hypothetical protein ES703_101379 [subsurface metagenome]